MTREEFTEWLFNHIGEGVDLEFGDDGNVIYADMEDGSSFTITITKE